MLPSEKVVIVIGKTGRGKNSLWNVIAGKKYKAEDFPIRFGETG